MKLIELTEEKFRNNANSHEQISFHQTKEWGILKKTNGWDMNYVGLVDNNDNIKGLALLLSKKLPIVGKKMFYSPRGVLIDYKDYNLLKEFTIKIKEYVKKKNGIFIKIDPYVPYQERDVNGDIVENGYLNNDIISNLKNNGYKHYGFNKDMTKELQPRFIFILDVDGKTEDDIWNNFSKQTKRHIQHAINEEIVVECTNDIEEFSNIMAHTSGRRGFTDRPKSYYERMVNTFKDNIKVMSAVLYPDKVLTSNKNKLKDLELKKQEVEKRVTEIGNQKSIDALKKVEEDITKINDKIIYIENIKSKYGNRIVMSSSMFITYGKEVLYLFGGSYDEFMKFNSQYLLQWEMIKYAINNNYPRYNFYGIEGDFSEKNGVYQFKKGFNGKVVEFIGEFDLVVNKFFYIMYKFLFGLYHFFKGIKAKLRKG